MQAFPWELIEVSRQAAEELIGNNPFEGHSGVFAVKTRMSRQGLLTNYLGSHQGNADLSFPNFIPSEKVVGRREICRGKE